jgi:hypothetical protein
MQHDAVIASRKAWFFDCYCKCYIRSAKFLGYLTVVIPLMGLSSLTI